jgi:hypothetical protein
MSTKPSTSHVKVFEDANSTVFDIVDNTTGDVVGQVQQFHPAADGSLPAESTEGAELREERTAEVEQRQDEAQAELAADNEAKADGA